MRLVLLNLLLALAFLALGRLGLALAIPPGYASAVFPAAGLALAAVLRGGPQLLPGVAAGAFLLSLSASAGMLPIGSTLALAAWNGLGSSLQAELGRRMLRNLSRLDVGSLLRFAVLGALTSTLCGASFGVTGLLALGVLGTDGAAITWLTWWLGDSLGVLLFTPLALLLMQPEARWRHLRRPVIGVLGIGFTLTLAMFLLLGRWEALDQERNLRERAEASAQRVTAALESVTTGAYYVERFVASDDPINGHAFADFVRLPLGLGITGLAYARELSLAEREAFESGDPVRNLPGVPIKEAGEQGAARAAGIRDRYFALQLVEPLETYREALGFDLLSDARRRAAIEEAFAQRRPVLSPRVRLIQNGSEDAVVVIYLPVQRRESRDYRELVSVVIRIEEFLGRVLGNGEGEDWSVSIVDVSANSDEARLLFSRPAPPDSHAAPLLQKVWRYGGREWAIALSPAPSKLSRQERPWQSWLVMLVGGLMVASLAALAAFSADHTTRIETMVAERTEDLARSEANSRAITESVPDALLSIDRRGRIQDANAAALHLLGAESADGLAARPLDAWLKVGDLGALIAAVPADAGLPPENRLLRSSAGEEIPVEMRIQPLPLDRRGLYSVLLRDLREQQAVERLKGDFMAVVSHELRTPLTSIKGALGLVRGGNLGPLPGTALPLLDMALGNAERLGQLIDDLLDFDRLDSGNRAIELQDHEVLPLLRDAIQRETPSASTRKIELELDVLDLANQPATRIAVHAGRLGQVLHHLLSNAIKFSPLAATVTLRASCREGKLVIEVRDHGPGIPAELRDKVFTRFWQADGGAGRQYGGTGMGLAISRNLVQRMQGQIGFDSLPGMGCRFWIAFPLRNGEAEPNLPA